MNIPTSFVYNSQKGEITEISIKHWIDKQNVIYQYNEIMFVKKRKKALIYAATCTNPQDIMLSERDQVCILPDSIYRKQRQSSKDRKQINGFLGHRVSI